MDTPHFVHDCDDCHYLGDTMVDVFNSDGVLVSSRFVDLYFCASEPTIIARYSDEGPDYGSGLEFGIINQRAYYRTALVRALKIPAFRDRIVSYCIQYLPSYIKQVNELLQST